MIVDMDKTLDNMWRGELVSAELNAVIAEIETRQYELLLQDYPEEQQVADHLTVIKKIATDRRRRASGVAAAGKVKNVIDVVDARLTVVAQLQKAEEEQIAAAARLEHLDLFVVTPEEVAAQMQQRMRDPMVNQLSIRTEEQLRFDAAQTGAHVQALNEWLKKHPGPPPKDSTNNPVQQPAVDTLRRWMVANGQLDEAELDSATDENEDEGAKKESK